MNLTDVKRYGWDENLAYLLIFLFPIAGMSVRHWLSGIFTLLSLLALARLSRKGPVLQTNESRLLWIVAALFGALILSDLVNGWSEAQTKALEVQIRVLLIIPLYLFMRQLPHAGDVVIKGTAVAGIVLGLQAVEDVYFGGMNRATGVYSPLILGGVAALVMVFMLVAALTGLLRGYWRVLAVFSAAGAALALALSGSRGAYLAGIGMIVLLPFLLLKGRYALAGLMAGIFMIAAAFQLSPTVENRSARAILEVERYFALENPADYRKHLTSSGQRFEMARAGWMIFLQSPVLGVGSDNYRQQARMLVKKGEVHRDAATHSHVHNIFIHFMATKGAVGTFFFLLFLAAAARIFIAGRKGARATFALGSSLLVGFILLATTEASPFIKGNYLAWFAVYVSAFTAWHRELQQRAAGPKGDRTSSLAADGHPAARLVQGA